MIKPFAPFALAGITLIALAGCQAAPTPLMPYQSASGAVQSAAAGGLTDVSSQDEVRRRAQGALNAYLLTNPLQLKMKAFGSKAPEQERRVLSAIFSKLAARSVGGGATEFVAASFLYGGTIPGTFFSYEAERTLRFTVDAKGTVTAFEHLDATAIKSIKIAASR